MCQRQQPGPNLTHGAALGGARTLTQQAAERRRKRGRALVKRGGMVFAGGRICENTVQRKNKKIKQKKKNKNNRKGSVGVCLCVSQHGVLCNACGVERTLPKEVCICAIGRRCASYVSPHTRLYSLRLSCRMVSLTAANTKRMFSVSVAQVK